MSEREYLAPRWGSSGLVVIDMQVDFAEGGASPIPGTAGVVPGVAELLGAYRRARLPIVHAIRLYVPGSGDVDPPRRALIESGASIVAPGTAGAGIVTGLTPPTVELDTEVLLDGRTQEVGPDEVVMFKPRWGAFYRTGLEGWLRGRGVDTVVVAGCNLPNCPRATLFEASERDFRTVVVPDAVSQSTPERVADLELIGVRAVPLVEALAALAGTTSERAVPEPASREHVPMSGATGGVRG
ncbi:isochorismatase family cysteine hydrolase [Actinoplanes sp. NPDC051851]|uniref:cysteine hydrolase family protein n=1 Tax=Actinoplanes sp. NPDC051851 TaxID=3154753 RepID=UPI00344901FC